MKSLESLVISGRETLPLVEGGKGIAISTGETAGAWAEAGAVGTFSGVNADYFDTNGNIVPFTYQGRSRQDRHDEMIVHAIKGGIAQARVAHDISKGNGRIHMNVLWEMGGCEDILRGILDGAKGLVHGVTCGAGMPYKVGEIASAYGVYYYPIVSSGRAFKALWKRSFHKFAEFLGGVVYEDPWLAGGHNGLSNSEDPKVPQPPLGRVVELRKTMREVGCPECPIIVAGGVWNLRDWQDFIGNPDIGPVAFQFGTRALLTKESPIACAWKKLLMKLTPGDVLLHRFSPTGFYSSSVKNDFIAEMCQRLEHEIPYSDEPAGDKTEIVTIGARNIPIYVAAADKAKAEEWIKDGFSAALKTPEKSVIYVTPERSKLIQRDVADCVGCLSACGFSSWAQGEKGTTGRIPDPRTFCIQKTLKNVAHGGDVDHELMFAGHHAHLFASDPLFAGALSGNFPTVRQLIDRILTGD